MFVFPSHEKLNFIWSYEKVTGKMAELVRIFSTFIQAM